MTASIKINGVQIKSTVSCKINDDAIEIITHRIDYFSGKEPERLRQFDADIADVPIEVTMHFGVNDVVYRGRVATLHSNEGVPGSNSSVPMLKTRLKLSEPIKISEIGVATYQTD